MKVNTLIDQIREIVKPFAEELNYEIYHIEYVKENGDYYLRIYIDKDGGITLSDCEALSRRVSDAMDEKDPIVEPYYLEVSSPGLNRGLYCNEHFKRFIGREVLIKYIKTIDGRKNVKGILKEINEESVLVEADCLVTVLKNNIKSANLDGEI